MCVIAKINHTITHIASTDGHTDTNFLQPSSSMAISFSDTSHRFLVPAVIMDSSTHTVADL